MSKIKEVSLHSGQLPLFRNEIGIVFVIKQKFKNAVYT